MTHRRLFLVAYDVCHPGRLQRTLRVVKDYACGGQKSAYECYLTEAERRRMLLRVEFELDLSEDRFMVVPLRAGGAVHCLGTAVPARDAGFVYIG